MFTSVAHEPKPRRSAPNLPMNIVMRAKTPSSKVVVVGYGTQRKKGFYRKCSNCKRICWLIKPVQSFDQALAGRVTPERIRLPSERGFEQPTAVRSAEYRDVSSILRGVHIHWLVVDWRTYSDWRTSVQQCRAVMPHWHQYPAKRYQTTMACCITTPPALPSAVAVPPVAVVGQFH